MQSSFAYSLLPSSSRRSSTATTSAASSRRSSTSGGAGSSGGRRRSFSHLAVVCGFALATVFFAYDAWTASAGAGELAAAPEAGSEDFARLYRTFKPDRTPPPSSSSSSSQAPGVVPVPTYGDACLEDWLGRGEPCDELGEAEAIELDAVISWVNGSDPLWHEQYAYYSSVSRIPKGWGLAPIRHYREKDELRHALRALHANLGSRLRTVHVVLGDWAYAHDPSSTAAAEGERIGQVPAWLETDVLGVESEHGVRVVVHHHAELFRDRTLAPGDVDGDRAYLERVLPTFNSFAIEGQMPNIPGLAPHWIALNDDFFVSQPHSQSDWYTPAYGPLLRLESPTGHAGLVDFATEYPPAACPHERSALLRSNWLMSRRFGARKRVPLAHIPKVQSTALLLESAEIWKADFSVSSGRRFREVEEGETADSRVGDLHAVWLGALLLVERSREAMLWTWAVARMGGLDGTWGDAERQEIATLLGFDLAKAPRSVAVEAFDREARPTVSEATLHSNLGEMGLPTPEVSEVLFSSLDGPEPGRGNQAKACKVDLAQCFGAFWTAAPGTTTPAASILTRLAFERPECGDCILSAVVRASGVKGLSALLPPARPAADRTSSRAAIVDTPHLPLTKTWEEADFALGAVVPDLSEVDLRTWCLRLIARYQYSLGEQSNLFAQVFFPDDIFAIQAKLEREPVSTLVLNDDLDGTLGQQQRASDNIRDWLEQAWPEPAWWERGFTDTDSTRA